MAARQRGRPKGSGSRLEPWQKAQIAKTLRDKMPDRVKLPFYLWTREAVVALVERRSGRESQCGGTKPGAQPSGSHGAGARVPAFPTAQTPHRASIFTGRTRPLRCSVRHFTLPVVNLPLRPVLDPFAMLRALRKNIGKRNDLEPRPPLHGSSTGRPVSGPRRSGSSTPSSRAAPGIGAPRSPVRPGRPVPPHPATGRYLSRSGPASISLRRSPGEAASRTSPRDLPVRSRLRRERPELEPRVRQFPGPGGCCRVRRRCPGPERWF
jgi:hypothetical protein